MKLKDFVKKIRSFVEPNKRIGTRFEDAWFYITISLLYILLLILAIKNGL